VTSAQILILTNAALVAILGFMIRMWISDLKQSIRDINGPDGTIGKINKRLDNMDDEKVSVRSYEKFQDEVKKEIHEHGGNFDGRKR
jgi:hypothetical protein